MTPFGIAVWQQPMPEQHPSTTSLILEHRDMHPVVYAVPLKPFIKAYVSQPMAVNLLLVWETGNLDNLIQGSLLYVPGPELL